MCLLAAMVRLHRDDKRLANAINSAVRDPARSNLSWGQGAETSTVVLAQLITPLIELTKKAANGVIMA